MKERLGALDKIYLVLRLAALVVAWFYAYSLPFATISFLRFIHPFSLTAFFTILLVVVSCLLILLPRRLHAYLYWAVLPFDLAFIILFDRLFGASQGIFYLGYFAVAIFYALYFDFAQGISAGAVATLAFLLGGFRDLTGRGLVDLSVKAIFILGISFTISYISRRRRQEILKTQLDELSEKLPIIDETSGLYNTRYLKHRLKVELKRAERYGRSLSFVLVDLGNYGEEAKVAGNLCLSETAKVLKQFCRASDVVGCYNKERFALILTEADASGGFMAAERVRNGIEEALPTEARGKVDVNLGVASYPVHAANFKDLTEQASQALAEAERYGNRVSGPT